MPNRDKSSAVCKRQRRPVDRVDNGCGPASVGRDRADHEFLRGQARIDMADGEDWSVVVAAAQGIVGVDPSDTAVLSKDLGIGVRPPTTRWRTIG